MGISELYGPDVKRFRAWTSVSATCPFFAIICCGVTCGERRVNVVLTLHYCLFDPVSGGWQTLMFVKKSSYLKLLPFWAYAKPGSVARTPLPFLPLYHFCSFLARFQKEKTVRKKCFSKSCNLKGEDNVHYLEPCRDFPKGGCRNINRESRTPRIDL